MEHPGYSTRRDMAAGATLFVLAVVWTVIVYFTVPIGSAVGPRTFPLVLGLILMGISAVLVAASLYNWRRQAEGLSEAREDTDGFGPEGARTALRLRVLVTVCGAIAIYGYLMQKLGFVVATFLTVVTLLLTLKERRVRVLLGMGLGITLGCWLVFGELLGAYIPRGTWISLF